MSKKTARRNYPPISMDEVKARLLKSGKITEESLREAQRALDADPDIQLARLGKSRHQVDPKDRLELE